MRLRDHIASLKENYSGYARRLGIPIPTITRYLRGERGFSATTIRIIMEDAAGAIAIEDLVPNPYQDNGSRSEEATKNITL